ncbi:hypothetical protein PENSPDRAFT_748889 [Peniophora sp. CONT]|nr:hypothetical protein PENSPDRAFT_748889 [Peniophora sp. CONT]
MSASMFASVSHTEHPPRSYTLAVRIVWTDQWLSATFDDGWKVSDLKRWLLAKLSNTDFAPPRARAPSPITFVAPRYEDEKGGEGWEGEDGEWGGTFSFEGPVMAPAPVAAGAGAHALVAFSTGLVLDDEARLGYYNLGEDELLELHPAGCVVRLGRGSVREYVRPYVLARVNVLRYVNPLEPETPAHSGKRRKVKLEWKARWLEINDGQLRILKAVTDSIAVFVADLDNLAMLELADAHLPHNAPIPSQHCATLTFRLPAPISSTSPALFTDPFAGSTPIASPQSDNEPVSRDRQMSADSVTSNEEPHTWGPLYSPQPAQSPSSQQPDKKSTYLVLDMADAHTHTHVLRVLHRHSPHTLSSVFVPASCLPYTPTSSKLTSSSGTNAHANVHLHADADGRPPHAYPEWRASLARKAQRAGLGPVPHALAVALYGAGALPSTQPQQSRHSTSTVTFASARFEDDTPPVELEWDNWPLDLPRQARKTVTASQEQREREREREREKEREWEWDREDVPPLPTREKRLSAAGYGRRASTVAPLPFSDLAPVPSTSQSQVEMSSSPTSTYSHAAYPPADSVASHDSAGTSTEHVHAPVPHYVQHEVGVGGRTTEAALLSSYSRALSPDAPAILPLLSPGSTSTVISAAASSSYSSKLSSKEEKRREKERVKRERERMEDSGVLSPMSRKGKGKEKREREETATFSSFGTSSSGSRREREEQSKGSAKSAPPTSAPSGIARARSMTVGGDSSFLNLASSREGSVRSDLSGIASKSKGKGKARAAMSVSEAGVSVDTFGDPPSVNESSATLWTGIQGPQGVMTSTVSVGSGSGSSVGTKWDRVDSGKGCPPKPKEKDGKEKEKDKKKGVFGGLRQLRPDKIVKGLDSALDFVDGRR